MATTTTTIKSIETFQFIRAYYQTTANQSFSINTKLLLVIMYSVIFLIVSVAFFLFKAESIGDFAYSYLITITVTMCVGFEIIIKSKIPKTLQFLDKYDEFIRKREFQRIYFIPRYFSFIFFTIEQDY